MFLSPAKILFKGIIAGILLYLIGFQLQAVWSFTVDDMYIALRYAQHWADGYGIVWNVGEPPVEGYSNFAYVFLGRLAYGLQFDPVFLLKGCGVIGLAVLLIAQFYLTRLWLPARLAIIPCLWLLAYRGQIIWTASGLETTWYQAMLMSALYAMLKACQFNAQDYTTKTHRWFVWALAAGLSFAVSGMLRPEAPGVFAVALLIMLVRRQSIPRFERVCGVTLTCFILSYGPYFLWRWYYFKQLLPNPVYCKGFIDPFNMTLDWHYLELLFPFMLLSAPCLRRGRDLGIELLISPSVIYLVLCLGADPVVAFDNRLFLPAFAMYLPVALLGMVQLCNKDWQVYTAALLIAFLCIPKLTLAQYREFCYNPKQGQQLRQRVNDWLRKNTVASDSVVLADSGMIPYESNRRFIDSYCLNNKNMTHGPRQTMFARFCQDIFSIQPDVIILTALVEGSRVSYAPADACLHQRLSHNDAYVHVKTFKTHPLNHHYYQYLVYTKDKQSHVH